MKITEIDKMIQSVTFGEEIINLRRKCFSTCDEPNRLIDFLDFLLNNEAVKEEIEQAFNNYTIENLYAAVY